MKHLSVGGWRQLLDNKGFGSFVPGKLPILFNLLQEVRDVFFFVEKSENDGSREIADCLKKHKIKTKDIRVVGVNTNWCVRQTVLGLLTVMKGNIGVVAKACNCNSIPSHLNALDEMAKYSRIQIL